MGDAGYEIIGKADYFLEGKYLGLVKKMPENKNEPCKGAIIIQVEKILKMG